MCVICKDYQKGLLTKEEAYRNLSEMIDSLPEDHSIEVIELINKEDENV